MTYPTLTAQRDADQAAYDKITKTTLPALEAKATEYWRKHEFHKRQDDAAKTGSVEAADARRIAKMTDGQIEDAKRQAGKHRAELNRLNVLLNADAELLAAKAAWQAASAAQVNATRAAQDVRAQLAEMEAAVRIEADKLKEAQAGQRAAALAELGFGDKPDGTTAAAAAKALQAAQIKVDALHEAMAQAGERIAAADLALLASDKPTRIGEGAILVAKLHQAQRDHAEAYAVHLEAVHRLHGAETAIGAVGPRVSLYNDTTNDEQARFASIAAELRALAEQGE